MPALLGVAYAVLFAVRFDGIVRAVYRNADIASAPVIGELAHEAPGGATITLGYLPWYTTLWFEELTRWLPFHRQLWEVGPWLGSLVGIGLVILLIMVLRSRTD